MIKVSAPVVMLKRIFHVFHRSLRHSHSCGFIFGECGERFMSASVVRIVAESLHTREKMCLFMCVCGKCKSYWWMRVI